MVRSGTKQYQERKAGRPPGLHLEAAAVTDLAQQAAGGPAYHRRSSLERAHGDVRGDPFHPFTPEVTIATLGEAALAAARG